MLRKTLILLLIISAWTVFAQENPDKITYEQAGIAPEGIEWDAVGERFLVGSLTTGTIYQINDDGTVAPFIEDEDLVASVGIEIDEENNRLLVANSSREVFTDRAAIGQAMLAAYDMETGERIYMADLMLNAEGARYFANDVTVDDEGNAYVTNTLAPTIYKVNPDGEAEIWVEDERFANATVGGLNGIVYHPDGYIIAAVMGASELYKITLDDEPEITLIEIEQGVPGDGMVLLPDGSLVIVAVGGRVFKLTSEDDWTTATVDAMVSGYAPATTVAVRDEDVYLTYAYLSNPNQETYEIVRVEFDMNQ